MKRHQVVVGLSTLLLAAALPACGIRGRPQPPLIILPVAVSDLSAVRLGDEVHLELTVPEANADGSQPPDIERIDIYAVTTLPEADDAPLVLDEWIEDADPILTLDVVVPAEPEAGVEEEPEERADDAPAEERTYAPGELVTAIEPLTPEIVEPEEIERDEEEDEEDEEELDEDGLEEAAHATPLAGPLVSPPLPRVPRRTYIAVAVSRRNRQSAAFAAPPVPVQPAPDPPGMPVVTYTETSIEIAWTAPDTAVLPVQRAVAADNAEGESPVEEVAEDAAEPAAAAAEPEAAEQTEPAEAVDPTEPAATVDETEPEAEAAEEVQASEAGEVAEDASETPAPPVLESTMLLPLQTPTRYDVYDVSPPAATETESEAGEGGEIDAGDGGIPRPLNDQPLAATSHPGVEATLGVERCFLVRTVDTVDPLDSLPLRSAPSETACVLLADIFPPAAPTGLVAVAGAGAISLTWTANGEADLAGYVVLRGRDPEAELEALTPEPIAVTNYQDTEVETGLGYVYAVQAVDRADPPNVSAASEQVVEQAP